MFLVRAHLSFPKTHQAAEHYSAAAENLLRGTAAAACSRDLRATNFGMC